MQGLILVTWEKFLAMRFGTAFLSTYRSSIGGTTTTFPLATQVYDDEILLLGVQAACKLSGFPADTLLREYGRYFILNGLTGHLCAYLLSRVHSGRELLLVMRDAHAQMRRTPHALTPPLFSYESLPGHNPDAFTLIYDSPRKLCAVLLGAIEGAAERFNEQVHIGEQTCMKHGAAVCRIEVAFYFAKYNQLQQVETVEQHEMWQKKQNLADIVLMVLPREEGVTLLEVQKRLRGLQLDQTSTRLSVLLEALYHLQFVGLVASSTDEDMMRRRYWRAPTI